MSGHARSDDNDQEMFRQELPVPALHLRAELRVPRLVRVQRLCRPLTVATIKASSGAPGSGRTGKGESTVTTTAILIGVALAIAVGAFATITGFDRERAFYPTILIVVGCFYVLFAVQGSGPTILAWEVGGLLMLAAAAVLGFRSSLWIVVAGLAGHGLFDAIHGHVMANPGVPAWWPSFCAAFDVTAALWLAFRMIGTGKTAPSSQVRV